MTDAIATTTPDALTMSVNEIMDILNGVDEGGDPIQPWDLPVVKFPTGSGKNFTVQTLDGELNLPTLTGIIVGIRPMRTYFKSKDPQKGVQPDCQSREEIDDKGYMSLVGTEFGRCDVCEKGKFGPNNEPPVCKEYRVVYMLMKDNLFPHVVIVPPTGIGNIKKYTKMLRVNMSRTWWVETNLTLATDENGNGTMYPRLQVPDVSRKLEGDEKAKMTEYSSAFSVWLAEAAHSNNTNNMDNTPVME